MNVKPMNKLNWVFNQTSEEVVKLKPLLGLTPQLNPKLGLYSS